MLHGKPSAVLPRGTQRDPFFVPHPKIYTTSVRDQIVDAGKMVTRNDVHRTVQRYREKVRKGLERKEKKSYVGRERVNKVVRKQWKVEKRNVKVAVDKWKKREEKKKAVEKGKMEAKKKTKGKVAVVSKDKKLSQKYGVGLKMLAQNAQAATSGAKPAATSGAKPAATSGAKPAATSGAKPAVTSGAKPAVTSGAKPAVTSGAKPAATSGAKPAATPGAKPAVKKVANKSGSESDVKPKVVHPNIKRMDSKYGNKLNPSHVNGNFKTVIKKKLKNYNKLGTTIPHE
jgi:hypothetical protein